MKHLKLLLLFIFFLCAIFARAEPSDWHAWIITTARTDWKDSYSPAGDVMIIYGEKGSSYIVPDQSGNQVLIPKKNCKIISADEAAFTLMKQLNAALEQLESRKAPAAKP